MSTKHFFNNADKLVQDSLESLTFINPTLQYLKSEKSIINATHDPTTHVTLLSGGGAGHEPSHAAYVGHNMLTAAVSGSIFASPSVSQILNTIKHVSGTPGNSAGTLLIIKNYTGDVFNFSLAASKAAAVGLPTATVVVGDDVSVGRVKGGKVGRRGLAGTVFVHKIAGAVAGAGGSLEDVRAMAQSVADNLVTVGASLDHVHVPGRSVEAAEFLGDDELELGMGIHNEPGTRKISPVPELSKLAEEMLKMLLDNSDRDRLYVDFNDTARERVVLMVNNLGGTSVLELGGITMEVVGQLEKSWQITPVRTFVGTYMTSLDGPGFSVTLLKATEEMLEHLDIDAEANGWSPSAMSTLQKSYKRTKARVITDLQAEETTMPKSELTLDLKTLQRAIKTACNAVAAAEPKITEYDTQVGDGDCGTTLKRGADAVNEYVSSLGPDTTVDAITTLHRIAQLTEQNMDGTSGAIFSIYLNSLVSGLRSTSTTSSSSSSSSSSTPVSVKAWAAAATSALQGLQAVTPAREGDRTLMDALIPFVKTLEKTQDVGAAAKAARKGADGTLGMTAKLGRSVYVAEDAYKKCPDPGAVGLAVFFEGLAEAL